MGTSTNRVSAPQIRAARGILSWSQEDLFIHSGLSIATIRKLELGHVSPRGQTTIAIAHAFESAGLEFIEPNGVRQRPEGIVVYEGYDGACAFFDDVYLAAKKKRGEIILSYPSVKKYFIDMLGDYMDVHVQRMIAIKNDITVRCILTEDKDCLAASEYAEYRWISKNYVDVAPFYVYDNKYAIMILDVNPSPKIIVIQSRVVSDSLRQQFYSMWDKASPLNNLTKSLLKR